MTTDHPPDDPPEFHQKLLDYGERPYWTPDGKRIAFIAEHYGDAEEIDLQTREVRPLSRGLGEHHDFLRVLVLCNGDYLLIGPARYRDPHASRWRESELWLMDSALVVHNT